MSVITFASLLAVVLLGLVGSGIAQVDPAQQCLNDAPTKQLVKNYLAISNRVTAAVRANPSPSVFFLYQPIMAALQQLQDLFAPIAAGDSSAAARCLPAAVKLAQLTAPVSEFGIPLLLPNDDQWQGTSITAGPLERGARSLLLQFGTALGNVILPVDRNADPSKLSKYQSVAFRMTNWLTLLSAWSPGSGTQITSAECVRWATDLANVAVFVAGVDTDTSTDCSSTIPPTASGGGDPGQPTTDAYSNVTSASSVASPDSSSSVATTLSTVTSTVAGGSSAGPVTTTAASTGSPTTSMPAVGGGGYSGKK